MPINCTVCKISNRLFDTGGMEIQSMEEENLSDPVAMANYIIAIIPTILMLLEISLPGN